MVKETAGNADAMKGKLFHIYDASIYMCDSHYWGGVKYIHVGFTLLGGGQVYICVIHINP